MKQESKDYRPDVRKIFEESAPERIKERRRKAVQKLVDAGMIDRTTPPPPGAHAEAEADSMEEAPSAPSPWAKDGAAAGADGIDNATLPSAMVPPAAVTPAEERPVTKPAAPVKAARRWPASWILVLSCIGVGLTAMLAAVLVMLGRTTERAGAATPVQSVTATVSAMPSVTATASAMPSATATVSAMPSATATADAAPSAALPLAPEMSATPSVTPIPAPRAPRPKLPSKPHEPRDQPHHDVVLPKTAEPVSPPPPLPPTKPDAID